MISEVKRGEIYLAHFDNNECVGSEQKGVRPVIIIQNDIGNKFSTTTIVAFLTSKDKKDIPTHVHINSLSSNILLEQVRTISKHRLIKKIGEIPQNNMTEINIKLAYSLGLINMPPIYEK